MRLIQFIGVLSLFSLEAQASSGETEPPADMPKLISPSTPKKEKHIYTRDELLKLRNSPLSKEASIPQWLINEKQSPLKPGLTIKK